MEFGVAGVQVALASIEANIAAAAAKTSNSLSVVQAILVVIAIELFYGLELSRYEPLWREKLSDLWTHALWLLAYALGAVVYTLEQWPWLVALPFFAIAVAAVREWRRKRKHRD
jgi:hypothetical protein